MPYPAPIQSLFVQLQTRFPTSTLITELVQIQDGQYVVRALVQAGGTILTTAMAAASAIEQAEDRARMRVLAVLGITVETGVAVLPEIPPLLNGPTAPDQLFETENRFPFSNQAPPRGEVKLEENSTLPTYKPLETFSTLSNSENLVFPDQVAEDIERVPEEFGEVYSSGDYDGEEFAPPSPEPSLLSATKKTSSEPSFDLPTSPKPAKPDPEIVSVPEEPEDLSSLIAQTDIEMDRIGWTKQQGRDYLKRTYRKATRQKLEVDELLDFLNYLKALPSENGL